jgi:cell division inhibitor SepF
MEELELQERPGIFRRIFGIFVREREDEEEATPARKKIDRTNGIPVRSSGRTVVTIRRQVATFDDAMAAAEGLKRGDQQVLNLTGTDAALRQKIVDFMCGVNFAQEGTWEEVGDNVYMIAPSTVYVEMAPATPRMTAARN